MGEIDKKKLETALIYLQRITEGKNPINNLPVEEESVLNNPNMIRCMYFIKDVLVEVQKNDCIIGYIPTVKTRKKPYPVEALKQFTYKFDLPISKFAEQINGFVDTTVYERVNYKQILNWLLANNYLCMEYSERQGKFIKRPTDAGMKLGISIVNGVRHGGREYESIYYSKSAQEFIIQHFSSVLETSAVDPKTDAYRYLSSLSGEAKQFVISLVDKGEPNLYHSFMAVLAQKMDMTKEDVLNYYYVRNASSRPYLDEKRNLVNEVFELCWHQIHK